MNQFGVADPVITEYGKTGDQILVQLPGVKDVAQAKRLIISVAQLSLQIVEGIAPTREMLLRSSEGKRAAHPRRSWRVRATRPERASSTSCVARRS